MHRTYQRLQLHHFGAVLAHIRKIGSEKIDILSEGHVRRCNDLCVGEDVAQIALSVRSHRAREQR